MHLDGKTEKDTFEPSTITCPTAITKDSAPTNPQEKKPNFDPWGHLVYSTFGLNSGNWMRTHQGRADRAPTPGNDVGAKKNEQVVCVCAK